MRFFEVYHSVSAPVQLLMLAAGALLVPALLAAIIAAIAGNFWVLLGLAAAMLVSYFAMRYAKTPEDKDR